MLQKLFYFYQLSFSDKPIIIQFDLQIKASISESWNNEQKHLRLKKADIGEKQYKSKYLIIDQEKD